MKDVRGEEVHRSVATIVGIPPIGRGERREISRIGVPGRDETEVRGTNERKARLRGRRGDQGRKGKGAQKTGGRKARGREGSGVQRSDQTGVQGKGGSEVRGREGTGVLETDGLTGALETGEIGAQGRRGTGVPVISVNGVPQIEKIKVQGVREMGAREKGL